MKTEFSVDQIGAIAQRLRTYKKLHVTTRGQMFKVKADAEAAIRTLNMVIDDSNEFVGITELTSDDVTLEKLRTYAKDTSLFDKLFEDAKIPVSKNAKKPHERKREKPAIADKQEAENIMEALGKGKAPKDENLKELKFDEKVEKPKVETKKVGTPKPFNPNAKPIGKTPAPSK